MEKAVEGIVGVLLHRVVRNIDTVDAAIGVLRQSGERVRQRGGRVDIDAGPEAASRRLNARAKVLRVAERQRNTRIVAVDTIAEREKRGAVQLQVEQTVGTLRELRPCRSECAGELEILELDTRIGVAKSLVKRVEHVDGE